MISAGAKKDTCAILSATSLLFFAFNTIFPTNKDKRLRFLQAFFPKPVHIIQMPVQYGLFIPGCGQDDIAG